MAREGGSREQRCWEKKSLGARKFISEHETSNAMTKLLSLGRKKKSCAEATQRQRLLALAHHVSALADSEAMRYQQVPALIAALDSDTLAALVKVYSLSGAFLFLVTRNREFQGRSPLEMLFNPAARGRKRVLKFLERAAARPPKEEPTKRG